MAYFAILKKTIKPLCFSANIFLEFGLVEFAPSCCLTEKQNAAITNPSSTLGGGAKLKPANARHAFLRRKTCQAVVENKKIIHGKSDHSWICL